MEERALDGGMTSNKTIKNETSLKAKEKITHFAEQLFQVLFFRFLSFLVLSFRDLATSSPFIIPSVENFVLEEKYFITETGEEKHFLLYCYYFFVTQRFSFENDSM